jgi:hypothetical protein
MRSLGAHQAIKRWPFDQSHGGHGTQDQANFGVPPVPIILPKGVRYDSNGGGCQASKKPNSGGFFYWRWARKGYVAR